MSKVTRAKSPTGRLTENQYNLLLHVLLNQILQEGGGPIKWSPTDYAGSVPSKSKAVILSKRLTSLVERGLLSRNGNEVELTDLGYRALSSYVDTAQDNANAAYTSALLRLEDAWKQARSIAETQKFLRSKVLSRHYTYDLPDDALETTKAVLEDINKNLYDEIDELLEYVKESVEMIKQNRKGSK